MALNIGSKPAVKKVTGVITTTANVYGGKADPFTTKARTGSIDFPGGGSKNGIESKKA